MTFKDPLMKLFVVAELMRRKRIALGAPNAFFLRLLGRPHDTKVDGYRAHPRALDYFAQLALGADDLAAVEQLDLDGGNPVFRYVDPNWQGYSSGIDTVRRLDDIALLPNLAVFSNSAFLAEDARLSFAPFRGLSRLTTINASFESYADLDAFLALPALTACRVLSNTLYADVMTRGHPARRVMETLRARREGAGPLDFALRPAVRIAAGARSAAGVRERYRPAHRRAIIGGQKNPGGS